MSFAAPTRHALPSVAAIRAAMIHG